LNRLEFPIILLGDEKEVRLVKVSEKVDNGVLYKTHHHI
jgi:hypothetical protein